MLFCVVYISQRLYDTNSIAESGKHLEKTYNLPQYLNGNFLSTSAVLVYSGPYDLTQKESRNPVIKWNLQFK